MAENLNSEASEFVEGESNPSDFTADAVVEVVKATDDKEEVARIGNAEKYGDEEGRSTVLEAVDARYSELNDSDDSEEEKDDPTVREAPDPEDAPKPVEDYSELDPTDDRYNPYQDPAVGSSSLADVIVVELQNGESPTLEACRAAYKDAKKN